MPADTPAIVRALLAAPFPVDEPLYMRAWRFVVNATRHYVPVSESHFLHEPRLFLRSVGAGFCDDRATVLALIWKATGYDAKVWGIEGHVVPEVYDGVRWRMLDPDLGVFYRRRDGEIASFLDLQIDPSLITSPTDPLYVGSYADFVYSPGFADLYASWWNNWPAWQMSTPLPVPPPDELVLPPDASLRIDLEPQFPMQTIYEDYVLQSGRIQIELPPGFSGTLPLAFVIADIRGQGRISLLGHEVDVGTGNVAALLAAYYRGAASSAVREIQVLSVGPGGLKVDMLINPTPFGAARSVELSLRGEGVSAIKLAPALY